MDLADQLLTAVLANLLGIRATTVFHLAGEAGREWSNYAAQISRESIAIHVE